MKIIGENQEDKEKNAGNTLDVNIQDDKGNTPLHYAALLNNIEFVKYLVDRLSADAGIKNNYGEKAFDLAAVDSDAYKFLKDKPSAR